MIEFSANGKCCVCGKGLALKYKTVGIDGIEPVRIVAHPWCKRRLDAGEKEPVEYWRSIGCYKK